MSPEDFPNPEAPRPADDDRTIVLLAVVFEGAILLLALFLGWLLDQPALDTFHWNAAEAALGVVATLPMLLVFLAIVRWPIGPLKQIKEFADNVVRPMLRRATILDLAGISVLAGLG